MALLNSCVKRPFIPRNVGREYGDAKLPLMVTHATEKNEWTINRVNHNFLGRALCFRYICRKMIGDSKARPKPTRKEFLELIRRNAERGFFDPPAPKPSTKKIELDSLPQPPDTIRVTNINPVPALKAVDPILKSDSLITLNEFLFEVNRHKLQAEYFPQLDALINFLQAHPTLEVNITGHTDNTGNEANNITLSTRRAEAVAEYLIKKGVRLEKIFFKGLGSSKPIVGNETEAGRGKNRRVEILLRNPNK